MPYYIAYRDFQKYIKDHYHQTGMRLSLTEIANHLYEKDVLSHSYTPIKSTELFEDLTSEELDEMINSINLTLTPQVTKTKFQESNISSNLKDVFALKHPNYIKAESHIHNYFEINYVTCGNCYFTFKNTKRTMKEGEICIIPPFSEHEIVPKDDATVLTIMIQKNYFESTFFSLLSENLLNYFFRTTLLESNQSNYLLFYVSNDNYLRTVFSNLLLECNQPDRFSMSACAHWLSLFFLTILRNYDDTVLHYNYQMGTDFSLMLQYIQHNYQTLTLSSLAELFLYSEPHLSTLIRLNTGYTFTDLIKKLRLSEALVYLTSSDLKIGEIADLIGYNSADHFSRVFRAEFDMSPQQYKKQHMLDKQFLPFSAVNN